MACELEFAVMASRHHRSAQPINLKIKAAFGAGVRPGWAAFFTLQERMSLANEVPQSPLRAPGHCHRLGNLSGQGRAFHQMVLFQHVPQKVRVDGNRLPAASGYSISLPQQSG
jgi:hypothetical protein